VTVNCTYAWCSPSVLPQCVGHKPSEPKENTRSFSYRGRHDDPGPAKERINARGGATGRAATPPQCGPNPTPWHHFRFSGPPQDPGFGRSGNHPSDRRSAKPKRLLGLQAIGGSNPASPTLIGTVPVTACPRRQPRPYLCPHRLEVRMPGSHPGSGVRFSVGVPISFVADEAIQTRTGRPGRFRSNVRRRTKNPGQGLSRGASRVSLYAPIV
jgi:hypothetical protein